MARFPMVRGAFVQVVLWLALFVATGVGRASAQTQLDFLGTPAARRPRTSLDTLKGVVNAMVLSAGTPADAQAVQTFLSGGAAPAGPKGAAGNGHNSGHQSVAPDAAIKVATKVDTAAGSAQKTKRAAAEPEAEPEAGAATSAPAAEPGPGGVLGQVVQAVINYSKSVAAAVSGNATLPVPGVSAGNVTALNTTATANSTSAGKETRARRATPNSGAQPATAAAEPTQEKSAPAADKKAQPAAEAPDLNKEKSTPVTDKKAQPATEAADVAQQKPTPKSQQDAEQVEMSAANATGHLHLPDDSRRQMTHEEARQVKQNAQGQQQAAQPGRRAKRRADKETAFKDAPFVTRRGAALGAPRARAEDEKKGAEQKNKKAADEQRQKEDNKKNDAEVLPRAPAGAKKARGRRSNAENNKEQKREEKGIQREERKVEDKEKKEEPKEAENAPAKGTQAHVQEVPKAPGTAEAAPQPQNAGGGHEKKGGRRRRSDAQKEKRIHEGETSSVQQKTEENPALKNDKQEKVEGKGLEGATSAAKKIPTKDAGDVQKPGESGGATAATRVQPTKSRRRRRAGHNSDRAKQAQKQKHQTAAFKQPSPRRARSLADAERRGLTPVLTASASAVVVSPEVLKSVGADVFKVHHHRHSHPKSANKAASKAAPSGSGAKARQRGAAPRTRRAIRELKPHELPPHKGAQPAQPKAGKGPKGPKGGRAPESVGGSVISIKSNPNVQTEVRTLKDGSQVVVKTGQGPPAAPSAAPAPAAPAAPASTAAPKKREVERVETQRKPSAARPDDDIETLKPKAQHILVKSPGGATKQYDIPHIPQGVTVRGTATFVKALKVIDTEAKVRRRRRAEKVDAVDGKLLIPKDDTNQGQKDVKNQQQDQRDVKGQQQGQKDSKGQQQQGQKDSKGQQQDQKGHQQQQQQQKNKKSQLQARRRRRAAPTPATSATSSSTTETVSEGQQDEGTVKIYGTLEGEMVKVKGYIKGDLTGAASAYVVPTLLSRYGDFVQGARNGEFFNDQGQQGGQRGEVGFYGSAAQRSLNGLNQRAQYGDSQAGQQGQRRDNGYYGNQQGVKSGHDIGRNFDTGQAFDKKGASGTYEDKNGNHRKGFKNAGFRNTYHKDESANSTSFFDDLNDEGGHKAFDQTGKSYLDQGANKNRGDFLNAAFVNDGTGKQGGFDGGTAYQDVRAQAGNAAHHDGFDDRAKLDYQHHGNNHGGTQTQGGKYFNGGGSFNQAEVAAAGGKRGGGGGGFHGMQRTGTGGGGVGFQGGFQNLGSSSGGDGGGFQTGSNGFQTGSNGFQSGSNGFQGGASGFQGGAGGGFRGGSTAGFQGGSTGFQGSSDFLGGRDGGGGNGFQSSVITSSGLYDPSSAVRNSNPYPYYPPPSPVPLMGPAGNGQGVLDLRGGTFYQGGGYRSQFLPEPAPMGPLTPLAFAPSSNKAMTSSMTSSPTPSAYHRFSKSSFRIGGEQDTGPNAGPDAVRGKGFATWETFGNSAQATSLRYALLAMPGLSRA